MIMGRVVVVSLSMFCRARAGPPSFNPNGANKVMLFAVYDMAKAVPERRYRPWHGQKLSIAVAPGLAWSKLVITASHVGRNGASTQMPAALPMRVSGCFLRPFSCFIKHSAIDCGLIMSSLV